ncbi:hypothetical protein STAS_07513 [Striga asiatica]|uniref:Uncharacterized protein n=1 Tax=Striga asiatica TaxID=4170 RepID=A0A5A7PFG1_STRAF|nr:hypothetical protein STAS_07513 [Striga asiatica]
MERENDEKAIESGESAIASSSSFKPKSGITESQLAKFQELQKRRLKIKAKSKTHENDKGDGKGKPHKKVVEARECKEPCKPAWDYAIVSNSEGKTVDVSPEEGSKSAGNSTMKKRQKLYWGLDVKERWERKSNM